MDLPVRFRARPRVPPADREPAAVCPRERVSGGGGGGGGGDEIRPIMAALFGGWMRRGRAAVDQETPGQTETHKGAGGGAPARRVPPSAAVNYCPHNLSHVQQRSLTQRGR